MNHQLHRTLLLVLATLSLTSARARERKADFDWQGRVAPGQTVEVSGLYGDIVVTPSLSAVLQVRAHRHGRRDDPGAVEVRAENADGRVRICTTRPGQGGECDPRPGAENVLDRDTAVDFRIELPVGCALVARTTYGDIDVRGISAQLRAFTQQGRIRVETSRGGELETGNGDIELLPGRMLPEQELHVRSVNGRVRLLVPADFDAEVTALTQNGRVFGEGAVGEHGGVPRAGEWRFGERRGRVRLETENGNIEVRKR